MNRDTASAGERPIGETILPPSSAGARHRGDVAVAAKGRGFFDEKRGKVREGSSWRYRWPMPRTPDPAQDLDA